MHNVTIYSTSTCAWCAKVKEYFKANNVEYTEINLTEEQDKIAEMVEKSGQMGVPVIDVDGEIVVGFDQPRLAELLNIS